jgi:hypothetical protein
MKAATRDSLRPYGLAAGELVVPEDFDAPLPEEILSSFESWSDPAPAPQEAGCAEESLVDEAEHRESDE